MAQSMNTRNAQMLDGNLLYSVLEEIRKTILANLWGKGSSRIKRL